MKRFIWGLMLLISVITFGESQAYRSMLDAYKHDFVRVREIPSGTSIVRGGDRVEADALLEVATTGYFGFSNFNSKGEKLDIIPGKEAVIIMPRIDYLEKYIDNLAKKHEDVYVFIMEKDKLNSDYGDRSYETYKKRGIENKIPKNVKVFRLKNESVTPVGDKNSFEFSNIFESKVFKNQIKPIYNSVSKVRIFGY